MSHTIQRATAVEALASLHDATPQPNLIHQQQPTHTTDTQHQPRTQATSSTTTTNTNNNNPTLDQASSNTQHHSLNLTSQQPKTAAIAGPSAAPHSQQYDAPPLTMSLGALAHEAAAACDPAIMPNYLSCNASPLFSQRPCSAAASSNSSPSTFSIFASCFNSPLGNSPPLQSPWGAWLANWEMSPLLRQLHSSGASPVQDLSKVAVVHAVYATMDDAEANLPTSIATCIAPSPNFQGAALSQMTHLLQHQQVKKQLLMRQEQRAEDEDKGLLSESTSSAIQHAAPRVFVRRRRSKNARKDDAAGHEADGGARAGAPGGMCASTSTEAQPLVPPAVTAAAPASAETGTWRTELCGGFPAAPKRRFDRAMIEHARQFEETRQMWGGRMTGVQR